MEITTMICPLYRFDSLCFQTVLSWIFKQSMGARHRVGIRLPYWPATLQRLAEFIPWNRCLGSINV
jgi:hypothetical protein